MIVEREPGGVLSFTALRATAIVLLRTKLPEIVIDENARLVLYITPVCIEATSGYSCSIDVSLRRFRQDSSPFSRAADMVYWDVVHHFTGPPGRAQSQVRNLMETALDVPIAEWLSLDEAARQCWRDYFNKNQLLAPLSPCGASMRE